MSEIKDYREIPLDKIVISEHNVRDDIPPMSYLEESILEKGVLQPIIVKEVNGKYEVIAGQLRVIACKSLEIETIPAIVKDIDSEEEIEESLIENVTKTELMPREMANAVKQLYEQYGSYRKLVAVLGKSKPWIHKRLAAAGLADVIEEEDGVPHAEHLPKDFTKTADISRVVMKIWKREPKKINEFLKKTEGRSRKEMKRILKFIENHPDWSVDKILEEADRQKEPPTPTSEEPEDVGIEYVDMEIESVGDKDDTEKKMAPIEEGEKQTTEEDTREIDTITFTPSSTVGEALSKYTQEKQMSVKDVVRSAIEEWLKQEGYL